MDYREEMIKLIRENGRYYNGPLPEIGIVGEGGKIKIDTMELDTDDYLINSSLRLDDKEKMYLHTKHTASGEYLSDGEHNGTLKEYKNNVLYPGDKVLLTKLDKSELYVIITKVVKPV